MQNSGVPISQAPTVIGWREWLALPDLGIKAIKAKIDTGARSSAIHAVGVENFFQQDREFVRFHIHPYQRNSVTTVHAEAEVVEYRRVRSSDGRESIRPVILIPVQLLGQTWPIEVTLANRDAMGFRMLLGRQALRGRFAVDPARSFVAGRKATIAVRLKPRKKRRKMSQRGAK